MIKRFIMVFPLIFFLFVSCQKDSELRRPGDISWARGIVWYQIFPERFRNGDPGNDPTAAEVPEADLEPGWQIHPWTSDWYKLQPWELKRSSYFYDVVFTRRYGGDLIGVIEKLDYLKSLGIDAIYFNPVFEAPSLHKYDAASYHHIDDNFGPNPQKDKQRLAETQETEDPATWIWTSADSTFLQLIQEAHKRGMRVVIDGVFNHSGTQFFAFQDILKNGPKSRYADWYEITSWDDPATPQNEFDYKGWWGVKSLPEFAEDSSGLKPGPRRYIFAITRRWMDPNGDGDPSDGIDGWRLDVIEEVAPPFWREWYALVKSINPAAITVAEIWHDASAWIRDKRVDATMNYLFARAVVKFFINQKLAVSGNQFSEEIDHMRKLYGDTLNILWNLIDSHDTDRLASMIINPDRKYDDKNSPRWNPNYDVRKPGREARKIQKQIIAFQMTFVGAPMVYYGDETGMWGADDPDDRKPMVWQDMKFEVERSHPLPGRTRPADTVAFDQHLFNFYQKMIRIRHEHAALMRGIFRHLPAAVSENTYGFARSTDNQEILAIFNRGNDREKMVIPPEQLNFRKYQDLLTGNNYSVKPSGLEIEVPGKGFLILSSNSK